MADSNLLFEIAEVFGEATNVLEACSSTLRLIAQEFDFDIGCFWRADYESLVMHCGAFETLGPEYDEFKRFCLAKKIGPGEGGPGRVWISRRALVIPELQKDTAFPRMLLASRSHLQSYCALPILHESLVFGVLEFFASVPRTLPESSLNQLEEIGRNIGDYFHKQKLDETLTGVPGPSLANLRTEAVITIDEESHIIFANQHACKLFGYESSEMVGELLTLLIPPEYRAMHLKGIGRYLSTGTRTMSWDGIHLPAMHKSGARINVEISFGEVVVGERRLFSGFVREMPAQEIPVSEKPASDPT